MDLYKQQVNIILHSGLLANDDYKLKCRRDSACPSRNTHCPSRDTRCLFRETRCRSRVILKSVWFVIQIITGETVNVHLVLDDAAGNSYMQVRSLLSWFLIGSCRVHSS